MTAAPQTADWPDVVTLRDGTEVFVRPIEADDKDKLARGFEQLSPEGRRSRFLTPMTRLSPRMLAYLTEVDHHDHEALVAETVEGEQPVGVARFVRLADRPDTAEVAVTVVDAWQRKGAATELLRRLAGRALEEGVERFSATCLATNSDVLELLEGLGSSEVRTTDDGLVEFEVVLPTRDESALVSALRRIASAALAVRYPGERNRR